MKKNVLAIVLSLLFLFPSLAFKYNTPDTPDGLGRTYKLSTLNKIEIRNRKGERLGEVEDFVMDPRRGQIAFVVFSQIGMVGTGDKIRIIPYQFLSFDEGGRNFVLDMSKEDLTSAIEVKNPQGDKLGEIADFVMDSTGRIPFVLLSHGGKMIFIPYGALSIEEDFFVLDASQEKLASAPVVNEKEDSIDQDKAKEIYRYFGQAPYWTEGF